MPNFLNKIFQQANSSVNGENKNKVMAEILNGMSFESYHDPIDGLSNAITKHNSAFDQISDKSPQNMAGISPKSRLESHPQVNVFGAATINGVQSISAMPDVEVSDEENMVVMQVTTCNSDSLHICEESEDAKSQCLYKDYRLL